MAHLIFSLSFNLMFGGGKDKPFFQENQCCAAFCSQKTLHVVEDGKKEGDFLCSTLLFANYENTKSNIVEGEKREKKLQKIFLLVGAVIVELRRYDGLRVLV